MMGHSIDGGFLRNWLEHGGLAQFGYPLSEEAIETSPDGVARMVRYFGRARLESHPEAAGISYGVQLGTLVREELQRAAGFAGCWAGQPLHSFGKPRHDLSALAAFR